MKLCLLLMGVVAVCCVLPSGVESKVAVSLSRRAATTFSRDADSPVVKKALTLHRRSHNVDKRDVIDLQGFLHASDEKMQEYRKEASEFLASREGKDLMAIIGIKPDELDRLAAEDDEIPEEDKDLFKVMFVIFVSGALNPGI